MAEQEQAKRVLTQKELNEQRRITRELYITFCNTIKRSYFVSSNNGNNQPEKERKRNSPKRELQGKPSCI